MSKVKPYQLEKDFVYQAGETRYLTGEKVETGKVLRVTHISGTFENAATTEHIQLGYYNGHAYIELKKAKPAVTGDFVHWNGNCWLREQQFVYAYFADVSAGEKMKLRAQGRWV